MNSAGFCIAVFGSNGVAVKLSCGANSDDWGDCEGCAGCALDLRPVNVSHLHSVSYVVPLQQHCGPSVHGHLGDVGWWCEEGLECCAWHCKAVYVSSNASDTIRNRPE
jgi:hypothetical protein